MLHDRFSELEFQLTASQGGWHTSDVSGIPAHRISTHSLTRRLTSLRVDFLSHVMHFNSQPHKEADDIPDWILQELLYFNSQPHKEADEPYRGILTGRQHFNSQPHKEADFYFFSICCIMFKFQLTASQGGWLLYCFHDGVSGIFQLTASQGGWLSFPISISSPALFQLTASQGGWLPCGISLFSPISISTHSLTRRLTDHLQLQCLPCTFQLTASQGGWHMLHQHHFHHLLFQLTASQGGWPKIAAMIADMATFQLTASQGGWPSSVHRYA